MTHRIVSTVVSIILAMFVVAALVFALAIQVRVPAAAGGANAMLIPHPVDGRAAMCPECHKVAGGSLPLTHRNYAGSRCMMCHGQKAIIEVPHSVAMGDGRCVLCHGDPDQDLGMPTDHLTFKDKRCLFCHRGDSRKAGVSARPAGESAAYKPPLKHPETGAFRTCTYCHRINGKPSMPTSHAAFVTEMCLWCHLTESQASAATTTAP